MSAHLVFVYNVDARPLALLRDLHQTITTGSTDCRLCDVTFGKLLKDRRWSRFVRDLPVPAEFCLRSTFRRRHPGYADHRFPAAFWVEEGEPRELIASGEIEACADLESLCRLVESRVAALGVPRELVSTRPG